MATLNDKSKIFTVQSCMTGKPQSDKVPRKKKRARYWNYSTRRANRKRWSHNVIKSFNTNDDDSKFTNGLYGLLALLILIVSPFTITLLPVKNVLANPEYWYEILLSTTSHGLFLTIAVTIELNAFFKDLFNKGKRRKMAELFMAYKVTEVVIFSFMHLIWSGILGYFEPVPFNLVISGCLSAIGMIIRIWYLLPKQVRMDPTTRKRYKAYALHGFWIIFFNIQLMLLGYYFLSHLTFQWMIVFIAPLMKEINDRVHDKIQTSYSSQEHLGETKFIGTILINIIYSFWLATHFSIITVEIEYTLLFINFCMNLFLCFKITRLSGKTCKVHSEAIKTRNLRNEILTYLILNETSEVLVPTAFIGSYACAYYGPNKNDLHLVGNHENVLEFLTPVIKMAFIDSGSLIIAGIVLHWFNGINIFKEYCRTIKKYWSYLAFWGGTFISSVSNITQKKQEQNGINVELSIE